MSKTKKYVLAFIAVVLCCNVFVTVMGNNAAPLKAEIAKFRAETEELRQFAKEAHTFRALKEELLQTKKQIEDGTTQLNELMKSLEVAKTDLAGAAQSVKSEALSMLEGTKKTISEHFEAAKKSFSESVAAAKGELTAIEKSLNELKAFSEKVASAEYERVKGEFERLSAHMAHMEKLLAK